MLIQFLLNGIAAGSIYALVTVALGVTYRTCGFIDLGQAAFFAAAAYVAFLSTVWLNLPVIVSMLLGVLSVGLAATAYHVIVLTQLRRKHAQKTVLLLASIGVFIMLEGILVMIFGAEARSYPRLITVEGIRILGGRLTPIQIISIITAIAVVCLWSAVIAFTQMGLVWQALASDKELAEIQGVRTDKTSRVAFITACSTAGLAGILQAHDTGLAPSMGFGVLLVALVGVVIGGNSIPANAVAALLLGVLQQTAVFFFPTYWQDAVVFLVLVVFLILRPCAVLSRSLWNAGV